jgi:hypothetical protein
VASDQRQFADRSRGDQVARLQPLRMRPDHERLGHQLVGSLLHFRQRPRLGGVHADRLFAEHVFACFERPDGPRHVQVIRQRIVDRLDLVVLQKRLVRTV